MSFLDKVKAGVKSGAEQAAAKAQVELERMQVKRELQQAYAALGEKALELAERGELSHAELTGAIDQVRALKGQLETIGSEPEPEPDAAEPASGSADEAPQTEQPPPA
jgi:hypothetical protein